MKLIHVTDDNGIPHHLNPEYILFVKPRPKDSPGCLVKFQNGNGLSVIEGCDNVVKQICSEEIDESWAGYRVP